MYYNVKCHNNKVILHLTLNCYKSINITIRINDTLFVKKKFQNGSNSRTEYSYILFNSVIMDDIIELISDDNDINIELLNENGTKYPIYKKDNDNIKNDENNERYQYQWEKKEKENNDKEKSNARMFYSFFSKRELFKRSNTW